MSKQYTKGNGSGDDQSKPLNNIVLVEQMKAAIIQQCFPKEMSKKREGRLEFAVRGGELGINYISDDRDLSPDTNELVRNVEIKPLVGLSRSGLKTMLMILESALIESDYIDHATVFVYYSAGDNGEFISGKLSIRRGIHHPRY
ncbi:hypothetical protein EHV15_34330 [Paenibacillus oralis]|uniref:Uncharacterized protein n=1 Tax=Paenibacillus oralis TaxID=2490856 RepID=A0A3P3T9H0_9BACL|nr:hypothetical protein [Paenibacillus oralis]RRJ54677.1 hypothetical protein EHV15_34330 [Paenibacillus oralis]